MSVVEHHGDSSIAGITKRVNRKNTKDRIAYEVAKSIHILWDNKATPEEKLKQIEERLIGGLI